MCVLVQVSHRVRNGRCRAGFHSRPLPKHDRRVPWPLLNYPLCSHIFSVMWWVGAKKMTCASECKCKHHVCQISRAHALQVARNANRKANLRERMQVRYGYVPTPVPRRCYAGATPVPRRSLALEGCVGMSEVVSVGWDRGRVSSCRSTVLSPFRSFLAETKHSGGA